MVAASIAIGPAIGRERVAVRNRTEKTARRARPAPGPPTGFAKLVERSTGGVAWTASGAALLGGCVGGLVLGWRRDFKKLEVV